MMETVVRRMIVLTAIFHCLLPVLVVDAQTPTLAPTNAPTIPTFSPTLDGNFTAPECFRNTTVLYQAMLRANPFEQSTYIICNNTNIKVGIPDKDNNCCIDGDFSIFPRARSTIMCGEDGKSSNNCTLTGGNTQVFFVGAYYGDAISPDMVLQGITFDDADFVSAALAGRGDITFVDCVFRNHYRSSGTIFVAYSANDRPDNNRRYLAEDELMEIEDPLERAGKAMSREYMEAWTKEAVEQGQAAVAAGDKSADMSEDERQLQAAYLMELNFIDCKFEDNIQGPTDVAGIPLFGMVSILTPFNPTKIDGTDFINNKYDGSDGNQNGFAVQTIGSELEVTNSCFLGNSFIGFGPIQAFAGAPFTYEKNFCTEDDLIFCEFGAVTESFTPDNQADVECIYYDLQECRGGPREDWPEPTAAPSSANSWCRISTALMLSWFPVSLLLANEM